MDENTHLAHKGRLAAARARRHDEAHGEAAKLRHLRGRDARDVAQEARGARCGRRRSRRRVSLAVRHHGAVVLQLVVFARRLARARPGVLEADARPVGGHICGAATLRLVGLRKARAKRVVSALRLHVLHALKHLAQLAPARHQEPLALLRSCEGLHGAHHPALLRFCERHLQTKKTSGAKAVPSRPPLAQKRQKSLLQCA